MTRNTCNNMYESQSPGVKAAYKEDVWEPTTYFRKNSINIILLTFCTPAACMLHVNFGSFNELFLICLNEMTAKLDGTSTL